MRTALLKADFFEDIRDGVADSRGRCERKVDDAEGDTEHTRGFAADKLPHAGDLKGCFFDELRDFVQRRVLRQLSQGGAYDARTGDADVEHHVRLTESINPFNPAAQHGLNQLTQMGLSPEQAKVWVANEITRQGFLLGFNELFWLASIAFIGLAGLVWLSTPINKKIR